MARNARRADDVSWLPRTVKIPQYVAFACSKGLLKLIFVSFLVFAWLLQPKATHKTAWCGILRLITSGCSSSSSIRAEGISWKPSREHPQMYVWYLARRMCCRRLSDVGGKVSFFCFFWRNMMYLSSSAVCTLFLEVG